MPTRTLTNANPNWNMSSTAQIADKYHRYHIADLITRGDQSRETRWYLKSLLNGGDDGVYVTGTQGLLQRHQDTQQQDKYLNAGESLEGLRSTGEQATILTDEQQFIHGGVVKYT